MDNKQYFDSLFKSLEEVVESFSSTQADYDNSWSEMLVHKDRFKAEFKAKLDTYIDHRVKEMLLSVFNNIGKDNELKDLQ
jgi:hypothetical protein